MNQTEALEMNYYEILEVSESVTTDELKAAYVRLGKTCILFFQVNF